LYSWLILYDLYRVFQTVGADYDAIVTFLKYQIRSKTLAKLHFGSKGVIFIGEAIEMVQEITRFMKKSLISDAIAGKGRIVIQK